MFPTWHGVSGATAKLAETFKALGIMRLKCCQSAALKAAKSMCMGLMSLPSKLHTGAAVQWRMKSKKGQLVCAHCAKAKKRVSTRLAGTTQPRVTSAKQHDTEKMYHRAKSMGTRQCTNTASAPKVEQTARRIGKAHPVYP